MLDRLRSPNEADIKVTVVEDEKEQMDSEDYGNEEEYGEEE